MKDYSENHNFLDFNENEHGQKFVQIYLNDIPYFQFISVDGKHSQALEKILQNFNISYNKENFSGESIPEKMGKNYRLVGAGRCLKMADYFQVTGFGDEYSEGPNEKHFDETVKPNKFKFKI